MWWHAVVNTSFLYLSGLFGKGVKTKNMSKNTITASAGNADLQQSNLQTHQIFVGIDIGYRTHVACSCPGTLFNTKRYPDGWKRSKTIHFSSDAPGFKRLQGYLDKFSINPADFLILLEPTGGYYGL